MTGKIKLIHRSGGAHTPSNGGKNLPERELEGKLTLNLRGFDQNNNDQQQLIVLNTVVHVLPSMSIPLRRGVLACQSTPPQGGANTP